MGALRAVLVLLICWCSGGVGGGVGAAVRRGDPNGMSLLHNMMGHDELRRLALPHA
jgi:hypothetical protein